jgi:hypothetical protein
VRKFFCILFAAGAVIATSATVASGVTARCGTLYTSPCGPPHISSGVVAVCRAPGSRFRLPAITASSNAGIRRITVTFAGRTIASFRFSGRGPTNKKITGIFVSTRGLRSGVHSITLTIIDVRGRRATHTLRFAVCLPPPPPFTG